MAPTGSVCMRCAMRCRAALANPGSAMRSFGFTAGLGPNGRRMKSISPCRSVLRKFCAGVARFSGTKPRRIKPSSWATTVASSGNGPRIEAGASPRPITRWGWPNTRRSKHSSVTAPRSSCTMSSSRSSLDGWVRLRLSVVMLIAGLAITGRAIPPADPTMSLPNALMPEPACIRFSSEQLPLTGTLSVRVTGHDDSRLQAAISRLLHRWEERTGLKFAGSPVAAALGPILVIDCQGPGSAVPAVEEDEAYTLEVTARGATLRAATVVGAMRGMETLAQLLTKDLDRYVLPCVEIRDQPRFPWRGLMIDVVRHWQPAEVIKRNLDGMALVKLNVLHLHLTDDQGFRIESRTHPELQKEGSDGNYFAQAQMTEIIAYAQLRGIRVVPEFDLPGHAMSWAVSHPELASGPGPYAIERHWGVFDPVLDPTNEALYQLLDDFLGEMAGLFPDACIHIGGDENNGKQWNSNPRLQAFIREHGLNDNAGLQAYFNRRVAAILLRHGKTLMGWDEILHPGLPKDAIIQSWRGPGAIAAAAQQGYRGILSSGYYLDLMHPADEYYLNDPLPATTTLTAGEQQKIAGGEATMWSEWVTPEAIDSRIWPRAAAIAERLWSPREVRDVGDMYRRLALISVRLDETGLLQERNREPMLRR